MSADPVEKQAGKFEQGAKSAVQSDEQDAARYRWAKPILCGDDDALANSRAMALALKIAANVPVDAAIDQLMEKS